MGKSSDRANIRGMMEKVGQAMRALFSSKIVNRIDRKNRVSVPAPFRASMGRMDEQCFYAFPSFQSPCLECFPSWKMEEIAEKIASLDMFSPEQDSLNALIFASAQALSWDSDGRIALTDDFVAHAGISEHVAFVGKGYSFQIWAPDRLEAYLADLHNNAAINPPRIPAKNRENRNGT